MPVLPKFILGLGLCLAASFCLSAEKVEHPDYVGSQTCANCHQQQYQDWLGSHHDLAMQHANESSVLGDFNDATFDYNGIQSRFYRQGDQFWITTDGANGKLQNFRIEFTFGVDPLQQYLVRFDDGRVQTLSIAWDSRPVSIGGQRWFHLYPDEKVHSDDVLHWTHQAQNWNLQCAACHSTNLEKNYSLETNSYQTTWSEINIACEACHGAGVEHTRWANNPTTVTETKGFTKNLSVTARWLLEEGATTTKNLDINKGGAQIQVCASCHSRRSVIAEQAGHDFLDQYIPSRIEPGLYHDDGQILDEVYVYGSFTQSKMYEQGVTCTNCHNPHSLELVAPGNSLCAQCHNAQVFDIPKHHHHPLGSKGAACVNCHMPETTYMQVDPRRDHSIRIPRPAITQQFGAPNACNQCHSDQSTDWAVKNYADWYGDNLKYDHPVFAFHRAQTTPTESTHLLQNIAFDSSQALMTRASAVSSLAAAPSQDSLNTATRMLESEDSLVRFSALGLFEVLPTTQRVQILWPLLDDPVRAVHIEAARLLAGAQIASPKQREKLDVAIAEYEQSILLNADTSGGMAQLGDLYLTRGGYAKAEKAFLHAIKLEPLYLPARLNLADMYRLTDRENKASELLNDGLKLLPTHPDLNFAMGLSYVRSRQLATAEKYLAIAASEAPENTRYIYAHAISLYDLGQQQKAINILKMGNQQHPSDRNILAALVSYLQATEQHQEATGYAEKLSKLN